MEIDLDPAQTRLEKEREHFVAQRIGGSSGDILLVQTNSYSHTISRVSSINALIYYFHSHYRTPLLKACYSVLEILIMI